MSDTKTMLRAIINGQSSMKSELLGEIHKIDKKVDSLREEMKQGFKKVDDRLDKQGRSLAYLEDDTPTIKDFKKIEKRVGKVEQKFASV